MPSSRSDKSITRDTFQFLGACVFAVGLVVLVIWYASEHPNTELRYSSIAVIGITPILFGLLLRQFRSYMRRLQFWSGYVLALGVHVALWMIFVAGSELKAIPIMILAFLEYLLLVTLFSLLFGPAAEP